MKLFKSQLKITPTAQSLFAFCTLLFPPLVFANTDKKFTEKKPDPVRYYSVEQCQHVLAAYIDWHGRALAVEDDLGEEEYQWLASYNYRFYLPSMLRNPRVDLDEIYELMIAPEQSIAEFMGLSAVCTQNAEMSSMDGEVAVKVKFETGVTSVLYYSFNSKVKIIHGENYTANANRGGEIFKEFESFPKEALNRIGHERIKAQEDLKRIKSIKPNNLVFNNEEVEFWFDWPSDTLIKTTERVEAKYTEMGETRGYSVSEHYYESMISHANDGVRVSELADNRNYRFKTTPEEEWRLPDRSNVSECAAEQRKPEFCWLSMRDSITRHFEVPTIGLRRALPVDTLYMDEVEQWMDEQLQGIENRDLFKETMRDLLEQKKAENSEMVQDIRVYLRLVPAHRKKMKVGDAYPPFLGFVFPLVGYPTPHRPYTKYSLIEARYMGRVPCNQSDDSWQCAKIELRTEVSDAQSQTYPAEVIKNDIQLDFILEPHTLLVHEAHYRFRGELKSGSDTETVGDTTEIDISIFNSFETK